MTFFSFARLPSASTSAGWTAALFSLGSAPLVLGCSGSSTSPTTADASTMGSGGAATGGTGTTQTGTGSMTGSGGSSMVADAGGGGPNTGGAPGTGGGPAAGGACSTCAGGGPADASDGGSGDADTTGVLAVRATDFLNSLGVCTHIGQGVDDAAKSATAIQFAGLRGIRDDGSPSHVQDWITVHRNSGARLSLLTNQDVASTVDMAKQLNAAGALLAVEGPNEPNNFAVTYEGQTSSGTTFVPVAHLQRDLYQAVKAEPALKGVPVFHSSEAGGSEPDNVGLQFLTIPTGAGTLMPDGTAYADYANTHNYIVGHSAKLVDNLCWSAEDPTLNGDWDGLYVEYGRTWRGGFTGYSNADLQTLPRVTTETGWTTSGANSITEEQQGRLFLNLYLAAFKRGWSYTFVYMLRDDPNQGYWGFFDTSYGAKTSGTHLHNLTAVLSDTGSRTPQRLDYSIANEPATVHDLLMQKSDGTFELAVWNEQPGGGSVSVTVTFSRKHPHVLVYDPTVGVTATQTLSDVDSVSVTLSDHPNVLEL